MPGFSRWQRQSAHGLAHAFTLLPMFRIPVKMQKVSAASPLTQKPDQARRRFRLGMLVFIGMIGWALLTAMDKPSSVWRCCLALGSVC